MKRRQQIEIEGKKVQLVVKNRRGDVVEQHSWDGDFCITLLTIPNLDELDLQLEIKGKLRRALIDGKDVKQIRRVRVYEES